MIKTQDQVLDSVGELVQMYSSAAGTADRNMIRQLTSSHSEALKVLLGTKVAIAGERIPAPHLIKSGLRKLGQKLGRAPDIKVPAPRRHGRQKDHSAAAKDAQKAASKRERILHGLDRLDRMKVVLPQQGRWFGTYGFHVWTITERLHHGVPYVSAEMRDPYDCFPGFWGSTQDPTEMAVRRLIPRRALANIYPDHADTILNPKRGASLSMWERHSSGGWVAMATGSNYENPSNDGVVVVEYYDEDAIYVLLPEDEIVLSVIEHRLSRPAFVARRAPTFGPIEGRYDDVVGIQAAITRMNMLLIMATEDAVQTPTDIIGQPPRGGKYKKGRKEINLMEPGTQVQRNIPQVPFQAFQLTGSLENQLRTVATYNITDDGQSPHDGFITGTGLNQLQNAPGLEIREYQHLLADGLETVDAIRLEWEETRYGDMEKSITSMDRGTPYIETYIPSKDIDGHYYSTRFYGVMAGFDEAPKIITMIQLLSAGIIDKRIFQENLDGLEDYELVEERQIITMLRDSFLEKMRALSADPTNPQEQARADEAMLEIMRKPGQIMDIIEKFYTSQGDEPEPEQEQFIDEAGGPLAGLQGGGASIQSVLSQLSGSGVKGGAQTVATSQVP